MFVHITQAHLIHDDLIRAAKSGGKDDTETIKVIEARDNCVSSKEKIWFLGLIFISDGIQPDQGKSLETSNSTYQQI